MSGARTLPFDVARCTAKFADCRQKYQCARFTSPGDPERQAMADFSMLLGGDMQCRAFVDNGEAA